MECVCSHTGPGSRGRGGRGPITLVERHRAWVPQVAGWFLRELRAHLAGGPKPRAAVIMPERRLRYEMGWFRPGTTNAVGPCTTPTMVPDAVVVVANSNVQLRLEVELSPKTAARYHQLHKWLRHPPDPVLYVVRDADAEARLRRLLCGLPHTYVIGYGQSARLRPFLHLMWP